MVTQQLTRDQTRIHLRMNLYDYQLVSLPCEKASELRALEISFTDFLNVEKKNNITEPNGSWGNSGRLGGKS